MKVEYRVRFLDSSTLEKELNEQGQSGWELVQYDVMVGDPRTFQTPIRVVLKRIVKDVKMTGVLLSEAVQNNGSFA